MAKIVAKEYGRGENCSFKIEMAPGECYVLGFDFSEPMKDSRYEDAVSAAVRHYDSKKNGDLFLHICSEIEGQNLQRPLYIMQEKNEERLRIGRRIREIRGNMGLDAKKLSEMAGIDPANLSRIEQGRFSVGLDTLCKIASAMNCQLDFVKSERGRKEREKKISELMESVISGKVKPECDIFWRGAEVIVTDKPEDKEWGRVNYPGDLYVVTPYAKEVSWMFEQLRDIHYEILDCENKYAFYRGIGQAANKVIESGDNELIHIFLAMVLAAKSFDC